MISTIAKNAKLSTNEVPEVQIKNNSNWGLVNTFECWPLELRLYPECYQIRERSLYDSLKYAKACV